ncbi:MAG: type III-B CRISPR module-associated protein Cmr5 [Saprospiraceae bacterium]
MHKIETLIPAAIKAVEIFVTDQGKVPKQFNGYISSFGASVVQAGLLPTLAFYAEQKERGDKSSLLNAIYYVLTTEENREALRNKIEPRDLIKMVLPYAMKSPESEMFRKRFSKEKILNASVAIKLAIRTFPKTSK